MNVSSGILLRCNSVPRSDRVYPRAYPCMRAGSAAHVYAVAACVLRSCMLFWVMSAHVHGVQIRFDKLKELLCKHGGFGAIVAFKPTGWTFKGGASIAAPAASHTSPSGVSHHASITQGTVAAPLTAIQHSHAPLKDMLSKHELGAERNGGSVETERIDANGSSDDDAAQHISTACEGDMEDLHDETGGVTTRISLDVHCSCREHSSPDDKGYESKRYQRHHSSAAGEEGWHDGNGDIFGLDTLRVDENTGVAANLSATAAARQRDPTCECACSQCMTCLWRGRCLLPFCRSWGCCCRKCWDGRLHAAQSLRAQSIRQPCGGACPPAVPLLSSLATVASRCLQQGHCYTCLLLAGDRSSAVLHFGVPCRCAATCCEHPHGARQA